MDEDSKLNELRMKLIELHKKLREEMSKNWNRVLPFDELLFDRWEKAQFVKAGEGTNIYHMCYIYGNVKIGKNTWVGPFTILDGTGGLEIGNYCSISAGVQIYTHDTVKWAISGGKYKYEYAPVKIGNCCYIGPLTVIEKGVTVGDHCIIGAMSFVNKNIPHNSIAFGIPAKVVGKIVQNRNNVKIKFL